MTALDPEIEKLFDLHTMATQAAFAACKDCMDDLKARIESLEHRDTWDRKQMIFGKKQEKNK
jgi:molybdopterin synthase catalytic subunit